jgi:hypothetical protein
MGRHALLPEVQRVVNEPLSDQARGKNRVFLRAMRGHTAQPDFLVYLNIGAKAFL